MKAATREIMTRPETLERRGLMFVLSSPSGAGKTTISRKLLGHDPCIRMSVSVTTRPMRPGEIDGKDYHFTDRETFERMASDGEFLEWAEVFGKRADIFGTWAEVFGKLGGHFRYMGGGVR